MHHFLKHLSKKVYTRILCLLLSIVLISAIPAAQTEAAVVAQGIDVSKWQGIINWAAVAQSGVSFAFIRVGNTKKGIDDTFYYNMLSAQAVGIKTGVYIYSYATNVQEAAIEAQFVLNAIKDLPVSYPVVWDVEDDTQKNIPKETLTLMANTFCAIIESEGYTPMVYSSASWFKNRLGTLYYDKWVAQWSSACSIPDASIWQYTDSGRINGINGNVDLDYALKDYSNIIIDTGWVPRKGFLYYYINYKMQRGWLDLGLAKYYLDPFGRMVTGWLPLEDGTYYLQPDGIMSVGFTPIGNGMYYFDTDGKMQIGLQHLNGLTYYFAANGAMHTGFLDLPDGRRFFSTDGHMLTGLSIVDNRYYYFNENGIMQTGWQTIGDKTYLFSAEGSMAYGWFHDGIYSYYLSTIDGHKVTGFQTIEGKTYYFDESGHMITGAYDLNGISFLFAADGVMYTGWYHDGVTTRYYEQDGHMITGLATINGFIYYFDAAGNMQTGVVDVDGTPLLFDIDGKLITTPVQ